MFSLQFLHFIWQFAIDSLLLQKNHQGQHEGTVLHPRLHILQGSEDICQVQTWTDRTE